MNVTGAGMLKGPWRGISIEPGMGVTVLFVVLLEAIPQIGVGYFKVAESCAVVYHRKGKHISKLLFIFPQ